MIRDDEISRLKKYAQGLGCTVVLNYSSGETEDIAVCSFEENKIYIYMSAVKTKTELILTLIHEIAHYKSYINLGRKLPERFSDEWERFTFNETGFTKGFKKFITDMEIQDSLLWEEIVRDCDIRLSRKKIELNRAIDMLWYELWYLLDGPPDSKTWSEFKRLTIKHFKGS